MLRKGIVALGLLILPPAGETAGLTVEYREERLSVTTEGAPLTEILQEVARQTGVEVHGLEWLQERVSVRFSGLSLPGGLLRLLADVSYVLVEDPSPSGSRRPMVWILESRAPGSPAPVAASPAPAGAERLSAAASADPGAVTEHGMVMFTGTAVAPPELPVDPAPALPAAARRQKTSEHGMVVFSVGPDEE